MCTHKVRSVIAVSVSAGGDTRVDASGVGDHDEFVSGELAKIKFESRTMPEIDVHIRNGLAAVGVNELNIDVEIDTLLVLADIPTDVFAFDVCRNVVSNKFS